MKRIAKDNNMKVKWEQNGDKVERQILFAEKSTIQKVESKIKDLYLENSKYRY